jgi:hypothetical protein
MLLNTYISANGKEFDEAASAFLRASREDYRGIGGITGTDSSRVIVLNLQ